MRPHPLIIRTFDLGGDKVAGAVDSGDELNPFMGERAIRFCLENLDMFKAQLRAIIRASAVGNVKIMFPMISGLEELRRALAVLEECKAELEREGQAFNHETEVGAMIEIPSAAISADRLAREVDFFSIGTNDLIQYAIAVDRVNERIAHLYEPTHPAVLRLLKMVADAAHTHGIWVGVCGEMAGDLALVPLLLGLGMDELSVGASLVPRVKRAVQSLTSHRMPAACRRNSWNSIHRQRFWSAARKWRKRVTRICSVERARRFDCARSPLRVIPSRADGEGPRNRSTASALFLASTSSHAFHGLGGASSVGEVLRRLRGSG